MNLNFLFNFNNSDIFGDGIFTYRPLHFYQIHSIHIHVNGFYIPLVIAFFP